MTYGEQRENNRAKALKEAVKVWGHVAFYGGKTGNVSTILKIADALFAYVYAGTTHSREVTEADKALDAIINDKITPQTHANPSNSIDPDFYEKPRPSFRIEGAEFRDNPRPARERSFPGADPKPCVGGDGSDAEPSEPPSPGWSYSIDEPLPDLGMEP